MFVLFDLRIYVLVVGVTVSTGPPPILHLQNGLNDCVSLFPCVIQGQPLVVWLEKAWLPGSLMALTQMVPSTP